MVMLMVMLMLEVKWMKMIYKHTNIDIVLDKVIRDIVVVKFCKHFYSSMPDIMHYMIRKSLTINSIHNQIDQTIIKELNTNG